MEDLLAFLEQEITHGTRLEDILTAFEKMCEIPVDNSMFRNGTKDDDMVLYETGIETFDENSRFILSLVRQVPNHDEEFYQLHVDVFYEVTEINSTFDETTWDEDATGSIFDHIRNSEAFTYAGTQNYLKVEVYLDET